MFYNMIYQPVPSKFAPTQVSESVPIPCPSAHRTKRVALRRNTFMALLLLAYAPVGWGNITVTYDPTFPSTYQPALDYAVSLWNRLIDTSRDDVEIYATTDVQLFQSQFLVSPLSIIVDGDGHFVKGFTNAPTPNFQYPTALANQLAGKDLNNTTPVNPDTADMTIFIINSYNSSPLYLGIDGHPGATQVDLVTVFLQFITRGLGFLSSANSSCACWWGGPKIYDRFIATSKGQLIADPLFSSLELAAAFISDDLYFTGAKAIMANSGMAPKISAPKDIFLVGSVLRYLDETPLSFMTPSRYQITGVAIHDPGPLTLAILEDLGWQLKADLAVSQTVSNSTPNEGDSLTYTLTVTNHGPGEATNVQLTDTFPTASLTLTNQVPSGATSYHSPTGLWNVGTLANGATATLSLTATVKPGTPGSTINNHIEVTAVDQQDPDSTKNNAISTEDDYAQTAVTVNMNVSGYGSAPVVGSPINFTTTYPSDTTQTLTIQETGKATLTVASLVTNDSSRFTVSPTSLNITDGGTDTNVTITCKGNMAGTYTDTLTVAHNATGSPATYPLYCTVNKAPLTLTADHKTITEGNALPTFTVTANGFVNGDTTATLHNLALTTTATSSSSAGTYPITVTANATNYNLTTTNGTLTIQAAGFNLTESGGNTQVTESGAADTFDLVLTNAPGANVTITATPDTQLDLGAGAGMAVTKTFTATDWNTPQTLMVTAIDDTVINGQRPGVIRFTTASSISTFNNKFIADLKTTILDNENGVIITQTDGNTTVTEGGVTDTYTVKLSTQPTGDVTITWTPDAQITVSPSTLTFTNSNWDIPQIVTVRAVDDTTVENAHTSSITPSVASNDANYTGAAVKWVIDGTETTPVIVHITDNDAVAMGDTGSTSGTPENLSGTSGNTGDTLTSGNTTVIPVIASLPDQLSLGLHIQIEGTGRGKVRSDTGLICQSSDCQKNTDGNLVCDSQRCTQLVKMGSTVTLTPQADSGSVFSSWGGSEDCVDGKVMMTSGHLCIAFFHRSYSLTVVTQGPGQVMGYSSDQQPLIDCGSKCQTSVSDGTKVSLQAIPTQGMTFSGWSGECGTSTQNSLMVEVNQELKCQATFTTPVPVVTTPPVTQTPLVVASRPVTTSPLEETPLTVTTPPRTTGMIDNAPTTSPTSPVVTPPVTMFPATTPSMVTPSAVTTETTGTATPIPLTTTPPVETTPLPVVTPTSVVTISSLFVVTVPPVVTLWPVMIAGANFSCSPTGDIAEVCNYGGREVSNLNVQGSGMVSNGILATTVVNSGWVSNFTLTTTGKLSGGVVTGYIKNEGTMLDFEFKGRSIIGGTLGGTIRNTSLVGGYFQNVTLLPNTKIIGGILSGIITGDKNAPALLENVRVKSRSKLSGVRLGKGVKLEKGVLLEDRQ